MTAQRPADLTLSISFGSLGGWTSTPWWWSLYKTNEQKNHKESIRNTVSYCVLFWCPFQAHVSIMEVIWSPDTHQSCATLPLQGTKKVLVETVAIEATEMTTCQLISPSNTFHFFLRLYFDTFVRLQAKVETLTLGSRNYTWNLYSGRSTFYSLDISSPWKPHGGVPDWWFQYSGLKFPFHWCWSLTFVGNSQQRIFDQPRGQRWKSRQAKFGMWPKKIMSNVKCQVVEGFETLEIDSWIIHHTGYMIWLYGCFRK